MSSLIPLGSFPEQMRQFLPVGYRFHPTDDELVNHYLRRHILGFDVEPWIIPEIPGLYNIDPGSLPCRFRASSIVRSKEAEWWFLTRLSFKTQNSRKFDRQTPSGHWKTTGQEKKINAKVTNKLIGTMRNLVFVENEGSSSKESVWVMHEYRTFGANFPDQNFVICHLINKRDEFIDDSFSVEAGRMSLFMNLENDKARNNIPEIVMEAEMDPLAEALRPLVNPNLSPNPHVVDMGAPSNNHITNDNQFDGLNDLDYRVEKVGPINELLDYDFCGVLIDTYSDVSEISRQSSGTEPDMHNGLGWLSPVDRPIEQGEHADRLRQSAIRPPGNMPREETGVHAQDNSWEPNFPPIFMSKSGGYDTLMDSLRCAPIPTQAPSGRDRVQLQNKPSGKLASKGKVTPSKKPAVPRHKPILKWVKKHVTSEAKPAQLSCASEVSPPIPVLPRKYMFPPANDRVDFPPVAECTDKHGKYRHIPKVPNPTDVDEAGRTKKVSSVEAVLNWQTENALAQNEVLESIHSKISTVQTKLDHVDQKVDKTAATMQELLCSLEKLLNYI